MSICNIENIPLTLYNMNKPTNLKIIAPNYIIHSLDNKIYYCYIIKSIDKYFNVKAIKSNDNTNNIYSGYIYLPYEKCDIKIIKINKTYENIMKDIVNKLNELKNNYSGHIMFHFNKNFDRKIQRYSKFNYDLTIFFNNVINIINHYIKLNKFPVDFIIYNKNEVIINLKYNATYLYSYGYFYKTDYLKIHLNDNKFYCSVNNEKYELKMNINNYRKMFEYREKYKFLYECIEYLLSHDNIFIEYNDETKIIKYKNKDNEIFLISKHELNDKKKSYDKKLQYTIINLDKEISFTNDFLL
jgi:hypothetical protein